MIGRYFIFQVFCCGTEVTQFFVFVITYTTRKCILQVHDNRMKPYFQRLVLSPVTQIFWAPQLLSNYLNLPTTIIYVNPLVCKSNYNNLNMSPTGSMLCRLFEHVTIQKCNKTVLSHENGRRGEESFNHKLHDWWATRGWITVVCSSCTVKSTSTVKERRDTNPFTTMKVSTSSNKRMKNA